MQEIFVIICSYAYGTEKRSVETYDIDTQVGGLGRLIAIDLADQVSYEYSGGNNILTLIFEEESK